MRLRSRFTQKFSDRVFVKSAGHKLVEAPPDKLDLTSLAGSLLLDGLLHAFLTDYVYMVVVRPGPLRPGEVCDHPRKKGGSRLAAEFPVHSRQAPTTVRSAGGKNM
jgi:hypothetical protein